MDSFASTSLPIATPLPAGLPTLGSCLPNTSEQPLLVSFMAYCLMTWRAHDTGRAQAGLLPGRHTKPLAFLSLLSLLEPWAPDSELLADTPEGALFG